MEKNVAESFKSLLGAKAVITDLVGLATYEGDAGLDRGLPEGVIMPRTPDDVALIAKWASEHGMPLVARGAGTGLSGGAVAERGGLIIEFSRMNHLIELDEIGRSAIVEPGLVTLTFDELAKIKGLYYPPDPASSRASTLGGNLAENSGGPHCFKYGVTTNYVTGLHVILADGRQINLGGRALDYPEYDFVGLLVGSEGTLGLITQANVRLVCNPPATKTMMAAFNSIEEAGAAVSAIIAHGLVPATIELMDQKIMCILEDFTHAGLPVDAGAALIIETDGYGESVSPQMDEIAAILRGFNTREMRFAQTIEERDRIWYARKSTGGALTRLAPSYYPADCTVPRSQLASALNAISQVCDELGLRVGYLAHAGDGNLHPHILMDDPTDQALVERVYTAGRRVMEICVNHGGSITGEHGVGIEKREFMPLMFTADELGTMQDIKGIFNPKNLLNPGKIFPAPIFGSVDQPSRHSVRSVRTLQLDIIHPKSAQEASDTLWALGADEPIRCVRIQGGGTKSSHLSTADIVVSTCALRGIHKYMPDDLYVTVGAGTLLAQLQDELARDRLWIPMISPWPGSTIGGIVATNWNAPLRMRYGYGSIRDQVLATTVVLPDGRIICTGRPVVKNVAGYDMTKLFVGSHGTLGLIADVTLKLSTLPRARATVVVPCDSLERGLACGAGLLRICQVASALVLCHLCDVPGVAAPYVLLFTAEGMKEEVNAELDEVDVVLQTEGVAKLVTDNAISGSELWADWVRSTPSGVTLLRLGVAPKELPNWLQSHSSLSQRVPFIADLANGLLYMQALNGIQELEVALRSARESGGYVVLLNAMADRHATWRHAPDSLDLMRTLKTRWDPRGLLNPSELLDGTCEN